MKLTAQQAAQFERDGCPRPDMATFAVMMTDSVERNGALYVRIELTSAALDTAA